MARLEAGLRRRAILRLVVAFLCAAGTLRAIAEDAKVENRDGAVSSRRDRERSGRRRSDRIGVDGDAERGQPGRRGGDRRRERARREPKEGADAGWRCRRHGHHAKGEICEQCRKEWEALDPQKRRRIRQLQAQLRELDPQERGKLLRRLGEARPEDIRRAVENLHRVNDLAPEQRQEAIRKFHARIAYERRWRLVRDRLPETFRSEVERASPEERGEKIRALFVKYVNETINDERHRQRREEIIKTLSPHLQVRVRGMQPREQIRFLLGYETNQLFEKVFDDPETRKAVLEVSPRDLQEFVDLTGREARPAFFSESSWKRWTELKRQERERLVRHVYRYDRCRRGGRGGSHRGRAPGDRHSRSKDRSGGFSRPGAHEAAVRTVPPGPSSGRSSAGGEEGNSPR